MCLCLPISIEIFVLVFLLDIRSGILLLALTFMPCPALSFDGIVAYRIVQRTRTRLRLRSRSRRRSRVLTYLSFIFLYLS